MRVSLAAALLGCALVADAIGQPATNPTSCAEVLDLAGMIACRRAAEQDRDRRCAAPPQASLLPPTSGRRLLGFGDRTPSGSASQGVVLEGGGPNIVAPREGRVLYAGLFRSFGTIVIIDSCGIDVVVAGIDTVTTRAGSIVRSGEEIGTISSPASVVYLEARRADRRIDPFGSLTD